MTAAPLSKVGSVPCKIPANNPVASFLLVTSLIFLGLLHLESLTDRAAELPLAMVDVPLQLRHRDTTMLARHAATIATLLLSE